MSFSEKKTIAYYAESSTKTRMARNLGLADLTFLGIGGIIGAGVFVLTGIAAAKYAGPGVSISFIIAGVLCILVGLTYGEFASQITAAGSVYAYTFSALGEGMAFLCGWSLLLAYTVTAAAVAVGFADYVGGLMQALGLGLPDALLNIPSEGGLINLPGALITLILGAILVRGTKESSTLNMVLIFITLCAIFSFIGVSFPHTQAANLDPFLPFGWNGVAAGAAIVFFSFMGFDAVATSAEECKKPERDLPIGIVAAITVCMILYVGVSLTLTSLLSYTDLNVGDPVAYALRFIGYPTLANMVTIGILAGLITTLIVYIFGQSRIFFAMTRDGLLPASLCKLHEKYKTPYIVTIFGAALIAFISGFVPMMYIVELANTGTLAVFLLNFINLVVMRRNPDFQPKFRCPALWLIAPLGIIVCFYLIYALSLTTNLIYIGWMILGFIVYKTYGQTHSCWKTGTVQDEGK